MLALFAELSNVTSSAWMWLAASAASTCESVPESSLTVALPLDTCTAGASPKKLGNVYTRPMTSATSIATYFQRG
jgi:hypothetical protein